jgi:hypothetical protein
MTVKNTSSSREAREQLVSPIKMRAGMFLGITMRYGSGHPAGSHAKILRQKYSKIYGAGV